MDDLNLRLDCSFTLWTLLAVSELYDLGCLRLPVFLFVFWSTILDFLGCTYVDTSGFCLFLLLH